MLTLSQVKNATERWSVRLAVSFALGAIAAGTLTGAATAAESNFAPRIELFTLADRGNLRWLPNGDFLFRLGREQLTGTTYWAYQGNSKTIIATVTNPAVVDHETITESLLTAVADLPKRTGCSTGLVHRSRVRLVPDNYVFDATMGRNGFTPVLAEAEVENDVSGRTPPKLIDYHR